MHVDLMEIIVETTRQVLAIEGKDADNDEYVEEVLDKLFSDEEFIDYIARCITMNFSSTKFGTYEMKKR